MSKYLSRLLKASGDKYGSVVSDGIVGNENTHYLDTGCYALNALISADLFKGCPSNRSIAFAGETSTGKTFYALEILYHFLNDYPDAVAFYFDTEKSVDEEMLELRGIDTSRVVLSQPSTIEEFRTYAAKVLDDYETDAEEDRPPMAFFLDSMGQLSSNAEIENVSKGHNVVDMKKTQLLKGAFRVLTLRMGILNIPLITVGHTYAKIGSFIPGQEIGGGSALKYAASTIITLTKAKEKEGSQLIGAIISATTWKSRKSREGMKVKTRLLFDKGLDRYSGLLEIAEKSGVFQKQGPKWVVPGHEKTVFGKHINENPEKYFTQEVLEELNVWVNNNYKYSGTSRDEEILEEMSEDEED